MDILDLPFVGIPSFCKFPVATLSCLEKVGSDAAILGIPFDLGTQVRPGARYGPRGIRDLSTHYSGACNFDYDLGADFVPSDVKFVDCGDVDIIHYDADECLRRAREGVERVLESGAMPVILGGDHSITIPVLQAYEGHEPFSVIQIDTHLDFVDSIAGVVNGQGSPMRRASEMPHVESITHIGIHGAGSSRKEDFEQTLSSGNVIISRKEWLRAGLEGVLSKIAPSNRYFVTIDIDVMEGALAPGTGSPEPGGATYREVSDLLAGIAGLGKIVGFDLVEVSPPYDVAGITCLTASRLILDFLGAIFRKRPNKA
jgi:agmatinase